MIAIALAGGLSFGMLWMLAAPTARTKGQVPRTSSIVVNLIDRRDEIATRVDASNSPRAPLITTLTHERAIERKVNQGRPREESRPSPARYYAEPLPEQAAPNVSKRSDDEPASSAAAREEPVTQAPALRLDLPTAQRRGPHRDAAIGPATTGTVQAMAEAAGQRLNEGPALAPQRSASAVDEAFRRDCVASKSGAATGLLALPVIAWQAATGRCRP